MELTPEELWKAAAGWAQAEDSRIFREVYKDVINADAPDVPRIDLTRLEELARELARNPTKEKLAEIDAEARRIGLVRAAAPSEPTQVGAIVGKPVDGGEGV